MALYLHDGSVLDHRTRVVPGAAHEARRYREVLAGFVAAALPDVTASQAQLTVTRAGRTEDCLLVTPLAPRLRHFRTVHVATPVGADLRVDTYLVGAERLGGRFTAPVPRSALGRREAGALDGLVRAVQAWAVEPALAEVAGVATGPVPAGVAV